MRKTKRRLLALGLIAATLVFPSAPTLAQPGNALGTCLVDSLNGRERKQLAQWIFFGMAAHAELAAFTTITADDRTELDEITGSLITRIMTEDCGDEAQNAIQANGPAAIQSAFEMVGNVAMMELMADPNVATSLMNYQRYLDQEKFNALGVGN